MPKLRPGVLTGAALVAIAVWLLMPTADMLFAAHMMQHLLLISAVAPLLVLGGVKVRVLPIMSWLLFVAIFLFWHWPAVFQWAARHPPAGLFELASILAAAVIFWGSVLVPGRLNDGVRAMMVMTAAIVTDLPGVVMLFAPRAICAMPDENAVRFGLTPLQDQQIAGLLMWVPANLVFFSIATFLFARWIGVIENRPVLSS